MPINHNSSHFHGYNNIYKASFQCPCFTEKTGENCCTDKRRCASLLQQGRITQETEKRNGGSNASSESGLYLAQAKQTMQSDHVIDKDSSVQAVHMQSTFGYCCLSGLNV